MSSTDVLARLDHDVSCVQLFYYCTLSLIPFVLVPVASSHLSLSSVLLVLMIKTYFLYKICD